MINDKWIKDLKTIGLNFMNLKIIFLSILILTGCVKTTTYTADCIFAKPIDLSERRIEFFLQYSQDNEMKSFIAQILEHNNNVIAVCYKEPKMMIEQLKNV